MMKQEAIGVLEFQRLFPFFFSLLLALAYIPLRDFLLFRFILSLPYVKRYLFFGRVNSFFQAGALYIPICFGVFSWI
jgi:hypothetical protein